MASTEEKSTNGKTKVKAKDDLEEKTPAAETEKTGPFLKSLPSNPYVFLALAIIAVVSLVLTVYFWIDSKASRELTYFVNPARAVVVQSGKSTDLSISYQNQPIQGDITAAQIAIWNAGKLSIKSADVLKPTVIYTEGGEQILEATIRNPGRDVSQISLDRTKLKEGMVTLNWNILEKNDGAVIQIIYAGNPTSKIVADGIIEGQNHITLADSGGLLGTSLWMRLALVVLGIFFLVYFVYDLVTHIKEYGFFSMVGILSCLFFSVALALVISLVWEFVMSYTPIPFIFD